MQNKNISGLRPWAPGQSGNEKGRPPKGKCIPDILRLIGEEKIPEGPTRLEYICRKAFEAAEQGRPWALQWIGDRMEGKPIQQIHNTEDRGEDQTIEIGGRRIVVHS